MIRYFVINLILTLTTLKKKDMYKYPTARLRSRQEQQIRKELSPKKGSMWEETGNEEF